MGKLGGAVGCVVWSVERWVAGVLKVLEALQGKGCGGAGGWCAYLVASRVWRGPITYRTEVHLVV